MEPALKMILTTIQKDARDHRAMIEARLQKQEEKLDRLLAFKWQIMGGSFVLGILFQLIIAVIGGSKHGG